MAYTIRPATSADEGFIFEMLYEALFVPEGSEPLPRSILEEPDIAHYATGFGNRQGDTGFVADTTGESIGAVWVRLLSGGDRGYGYVDEETPELSIAVRPDWQGQGIGTALIARLIEVVPRMSLRSDARKPASRLYERLGFEIIASDRTSLTMLREA
jgi:GNAT superfamily N-acetyltransferase